MSFQPWREIQHLHAASIVHGLSDLGFSALLLVYRVWGFGAENHGQKPLGIGKTQNASHRTSWVSPPACIGIHIVSSIAGAALINLILM